MKRTLAAFAGTVALCAASMSIAQTVQPRQASIPFASQGGIADWHAPNDSVLFVMDRTGRWYQALFNPTCYNLGNESTLIFNAGITGQFDVFSSVTTSYGSCRLNSLTRSARPEAKGLKGIASATR